MRHLFLFTIGPVQSFISQARKTQDLYAGSRMLSDLSWEALQWLAGSNEEGRQFIREEDLILPRISLSQNNPETNLPNRFLTRITGLNREEIQKTGNALKQYIIEEAFQKTGYNRIIDKLEIDENTPLRQTVCNQLANALEIYWAAVPLNEGSDYQQQHQWLEKLLTGTKNTRLYVQMPEKGRKCHVDGKNNVVVYRQKAENDNPWWLDESKTSPRPVALKHGSKERLSFRQLSPGEGVSAVTLNKRLYDKEESFTSTADISVRHILSNLQDTKDREIDEALNTLWETDEQFIFEENLTDKKLKPFAERKEEITKAQQKIQSAINYRQYKLTPYYALIRFDADKMGDLISNKSYEFQQFLSEQLIKFAKWARQYVDRNFGKTVYAGGDDFLAFMNLNRLFTVIKELRKQFEAMVNAPLKEEYQISDDFTFSAGITIAHYKAPLNTVMEQAHQAEATAKDEEKGNRNAFCFVVMKHSGDISQAYGKWFPFAGSSLFLPDELQWLVEQLQNQTLSGTFIRSLSMEIKPLMNERGEVPSSHKEMVKQEFIRLIKQSCMEDELKGEVKNKACSIFEAFNITDGEFPFSNLIQMLYITEFIQRQIDSVNQKELA